MKRVLVPLAEGFEEMEAIIVIDVLRRAGLEVVSASLKEGPVTASRRSRHLADTTLEEALKNDFDAIVLPGGQPGSDNLRADVRLAQMLKKYKNENRVIAAICAAPNVLRHHGIITGSDPFVCFPGTENSASGGRQESGRLARSGQVFTSIGPGSAFEFALALVGELCTDEVREKVKLALQLPPGVA
ncbi:MAG: DJ-1/PfpI family protein [Spirochaetales bacterium]|nr:DJ-1/PfpI family protein [Spirochaetales bacterium]